jgi:hypothetical protein
MSGIPQLERVQFFAGQMLTADDLTVLDGNNRQLRWLHNRTLHAWGIGFGLDVMGATGSTSVTVNPGYANDSDGREILLASATQIPIPAVPGGPNGTAATYYLVAIYVTDANEPTEEQRSATACAPGGAVRLSNAPAILWKTAAQLNSGIDVVLGQVAIKNCVLSGPVATSVRRYAKPEQNFSPASGEISAADLQWQAWQPSGTIIGFTAAIDTSAAKFNVTPSYLVQVIGNRSLSSPALVVVDYVSITNASASGFTLQVAFPPMSGGINPAAITDPTGGPKLLTQLGWQIVWLGVGG